MRRLLILLIAALSSCCLSAAETPTHCNKNEEIYFNCQVEKTNKIASVCGSRSDDERKTLNYVQYRFGSINKIEFVFPKSTSRKDQTNKFYATSGITADHSLSRSEMSFRNGLWNYRLAYFEEEPDSNNPTQESIIQVWKTGERNKAIVLICANSDAGEELLLDQSLGDLSTPDFRYVGSLW